MITDETYRLIIFCIDVFLDTAVIDIEECFKGFVKRDDIDIILINQNVRRSGILYTFLRLREYDFLFPIDSRSPK